MNGNTDLLESPGAVLNLLGRNWWLLALRGLFAVLFGFLAFAWPGITLFVLVWLFGVYALLNGILSLVLAWKAPKGAPHSSLILGGILGIAAGLVTFVMPGITALGLVVVIAAWAIATGVMEIVAAIRLRKVISNELVWILAGIVSVAFGVFLLLRPGVGAIVLVWWIGSFALVFGILLIVLAFRIRRHRKV